MKALQYMKAFTGRLAKFQNSWSNLRGDWTLLPIMSQNLLQQLVSHSLKPWYLSDFTTYIHRKYIHQITMNHTTLIILALEVNQNLKGVLWHFTLLTSVASNIVHIEVTQNIAVINNPTPTSRSKIKELIACFS